MVSFQWTCITTFLTLTAFYAGMQWKERSSLEIDTVDTEGKRAGSIANTLRGFSSIGFNKSMTVADGSQAFLNQLQTKKPPTLVETDPTDKNSTATSQAFLNQSETKNPPPSSKADPTNNSSSAEEIMLEYFSKRKCQASQLPPAEKWLQQMIVQIGVQKGGTKAIHSFLEEDPQFVSRCANGHATFELNYFNYNVTDKADDSVMDQRTLQDNYAAFITEKCPLAVAGLKTDSKRLYLDDSPLYMQDSDMIPQLLNCVMPWAKILAVLRNPTDRAFSHFNFYLERDWCTEKTFSEWVDINIQDLKDAGVLDAKDEYEELLAWKRHNQRIDRKCRTFVTRGLYAVQILHYMMGLKAAGRPTSDLMVIHSEDMKGDERQNKYDEILTFLGLESHTLKRGASVHKTVYTREIHNETRARLESFYKPYNDRLYKLLHWEAVWG